MGYGLYDIAQIILSKLKMNKKLNIQVFQICISVSDNMYLGCGADLIPPSSVYSSLLNAITKELLKLLYTLPKSSQK